MGKIVKMKNKRTGVKVYPVTATKAVVDADSGERLNDTLKNKVEEAPMDGAQYVRKNGGWAVAEVSMDSNEICRINLKSNQGDEDNASLNGASVKVENTVTNEVLYNGAWDGNEIQLSIPGATTYKVTVGDVADYKTPDAITIEATAFSSRDLIMTYQTEVVSVTLSSDNGVSVVGQKVTINGREHTWNGSVISQKVAFGVSYSVSVDKKTGFTSTAPKSLISESISRNLEFVYKAIQNGIYIEGISGALYSKDEWHEQEAPNGVAVITDNCSFVINGYKRAYDYWVGVANMGQNGLVEGVFTTTVAGNAVLDLKGKENTDLIANHNEEGMSSDNLSVSIKKSKMPNGKSCYLLAEGELSILMANVTEINELFNLIHLSTIPGYGENFYWSSTQYDAINAWGYNNQSISASAKLNTEKKYYFVASELNL